VSSVAGGSKRLRDSSDDGDVRAYVVATLGWLRYVALETARGKRGKIESLHCVRRRSSRQIVFLMLGASALFQQEPKIKKYAGSEI
jgi:hypothetical protein